MLLVLLVLKPLVLLLLMLVWLMRLTRLVASVLFQWRLVVLLAMIETACGVVVWLQDNGHTETSRTSGPAVWHCAAENKHQTAVEFTDYRFYMFNHPQSPFPLPISLLAVAALCER